MVPYHTKTVLIITSRKQQQS